MKEFAFLCISNLKQWGCKKIVSLGMSVQKESLAVLNHLASGSYHIRLTLWTPATDITSSIVSATFHHSVAFPCLLLFLWQFYLTNIIINSKTSNPITGETLKDQIHQLPYFTYQNSRFTGKRDSPVVRKQKERDKARLQGYNSSIEHVHTESSVLKVMQCIYLVKLQMKREGFEPF